LIAKILATILPMLTLARLLYRDAFELNIHRTNKTWLTSLSLVQLHRGRNCAETATCPYISIDFFQSGRSHTLRWNEKPISYIRFVTSTRSP